MLKAVIDVEKRISVWNEKNPNSYVFFYDEDNGIYDTTSVTVGYSKYNSKNTEIEIPSEIKIFFLIFVFEHNSDKTHPKEMVIAKVAGL